MNHKMKSMGEKDFTVGKIEPIYNRATDFVVEHSNLMRELEESMYYRRREMKQKMLEVLIEKKEFIEMYLDCVNKNNFKILAIRYGGKGEGSKYTEVRNE